MPRLANNMAGRFPAQAGEERVGKPGVEAEARRQLDEDRPELAAETGDLVAKSVQRLAKIAQPALVRDRARQLDRE